MKEKIRICVVGNGRFAGNFVPLLKAHPFVEKVYVCDLIREKAERYAAKYGVEIIDTFEDAIYGDKVNCVAIFTQRFKHGKMVIEALKAGKHVYSAVPCTVDIEDVYEIAELVKKTKLTYSMGETGYYRAATCFCRREFLRGSFGKFVYGEAQYNHDIRNMESSFGKGENDDWRKFAGFPPLWYPTHSTSMILGTMPGVYATSVSASGYAGSPRTEIFGRGDVNFYDNPFSNTAMLLELSNGGVARISENRCVGWKSPETFISQYYGTDGGYEFSVARHSMAQWDPDRPGSVTMKDVTALCQPEEVSQLIESDYHAAIQRIADGIGFRSVSPIQPTARLPKAYADQANGHNGTHQFLIDDFCRAYWTGKLSPTNIWQVARFNLPGLVAHKSAMNGGVRMDVPDLGDAPKDWAVLSENDAEVDYGE